MQFSLVHAGGPHICDVKVDTNTESMILHSLDTDSIKIKVEPISKDPNSPDFFSILHFEGGKEQSARTQPLQS